MDLAPLPLPVVERLTAIAVLNGHAVFAPETTTIAYCLVCDRWLWSRSLYGRPIVERSLTEVCTDVVVVGKNEAQKHALQIIIDALHQEHDVS